MDGDDAARRLTGQLTPAQAYDLGITLRESGQLGQAEMLLRQALDSADPRVAPVAAASLALLLLQRGDVDGALDTYQLALDSGHPDAVPNAAFNVGVIRHELGDLQAAEAAYRRAIASGDPHWASSAAVRLGRLLESRGDPDGARAAWERAVELGGPAGEPAARAAAAELSALAPPRPAPIDVPAELRPLLDAAAAADRRYAETGDPAALDTAVANWRAVVDRAAATAAPAGFRAAAANSLAMTLVRRFQAAERSEDIDAAVEHAARAVELTPPGAPELARRLNNQGTALLTRYRAGERPDDLHAAIEALRATEQVTDPIGRPTFLANLGRALRTRYDVAGDPADLDAAIDACRAAEAAVAPNGRVPPEALECLAAGLWERYQRARRVADLDAAVDAQQRAAVAVDQAEPDSPALPPLLLTVVSGLMTRFELRHAPADVDVAVVAARAATARLGAGAEPDLVRLAAGALGRVLRARYRISGDVADLDGAIDAFSRLLDPPAATGPDPADLVELAHALLDRSDATAVEADLDRSIDLYGRAVALTQPGSSELADRLSDLGAALARRYERSGQLDSLGQAIDAHERAVEATPAGAAGRSTSLVNLAAALHLRYERTGEEADLRRAIEASRRAADAPGASVDARAAGLNNLAAGLLARYQLTGDVGDLHGAVDAFRRALELEPPPSPNAPSRLANLGGALRTLSQRTGDLADLDEAVSAFESAVAATPEGSVELPMHLGNLANGLGDRFAVAGDPADLERVVPAYERAIQLTPAGSPELPRYLVSLGGALLQQGGTGRADALRRAGQLLQRALELTPVGSPERHRSVSAFAGALVRRHAWSGDAADLDRAIDLQREALGLVGVRSPERPELLGDVAISLSARFVGNHDAADAEAADSAFRECCALALELDPRAALGAAQSWGFMAGARHAWPQAAEAYRAGLAAMAALFQRQALVRQKEAWLRRARDMGPAAAYALASAGEPAAAAVALEHSRALVLSEAVERERADLELLDDRGQGELRRRYEAAGDRLAALEEVRGAEAGVAKQREARAALDATIAEIRRLPGYERFLTLPEAAELIDIAAEGPLAYLAAAEEGGVGLVVSGSGVDVVRLPELTEAAVRERAGAYLRARAGGPAAFAAALDSLTGWLWLAAMGPLLSGLDGPEALTLVPAGLLGLLPLHAAWTADATAPTGRHYAIDVVRVSYAPNARVLHECRQTARARSAAAPLLLSVGDPRPVSQAPLPGAALEAAAAAEAFAGGTLLTGRDAGLEAVRVALAGATPGGTSHVHFACHGGTDLGAPRAGGLVMAGDELLTLGEVITLRLPARLAVLSACDTALAGTDLPDEVVSLPSGLLQAGLSGVVGTLWPVADARTMMLMVAFYERLRQPGTAPAEALRQAQRWMRDSTNGAKRDLYDGWLAAGRTWPPAAVAQACFETVALEEPAARGFAGPDGWSAFAYYGA